MVHPSAQDLHDLLSEYAAADATTVAHALICLHPTSHMVRLDNGVQVYTWCALDALIVPHLLGCDAEVRSQTPSCNYHHPLVLQIRGRALLAEASWVLSFPLAATHDGQRFTETFCPYANLFTTETEYEWWAATQSRPTVPLTIAAADAIAQEYAHDVLTRSPKTACLSLA